MESKIKIGESRSEVEHRAVGCETDSIDRDSEAARNWKRRRGKASYELVAMTPLLLFVRVYVCVLCCKGDKGRGENKVQGDNRREIGRFG